MNLIKKLFYSSLNGIRPLLAVGLSLTFCTLVFAQDVGNEVHYCFPSTKQDGPIAGMYPQMNSPNCRAARVIKNLQISVEYVQTKENPNFTGRDQPTYLSEAQYSVMIAKGFDVKGKEVEFGIRLNQYEQMQENLVSKGARGVHKLFDVKGYDGKEGSPQGMSIGGKDVSQRRQTLEGFIKAQVLTQDDQKNFFGKPDVAFILGYKVPTGGENDSDLDKLGASFGIAIEKQIIPQVTLMGAASISCKLEKSTSFAPELKERLCGDNYFGGVALHSEGGRAYTVIGITHNRNRLHYNSDDRAYSGDYILSFRYAGECYDAGVTFKQGRGMPMPDRQESDFSAGFNIHILKPRECAKEVSDGFSNLVKKLKAPFFPASSQ